MKLPRIVLIKKIITDIKGPILAIIMLAITGAYAFHYIEGVSMLDAFYFVVVSLATVGFGDVTPESSEGKLVTIAIIVLGISIISLSVSSIGNRVIKNMLNHDFRYEQAIKGYDNHIIVAGYGNIGRRIVQYLSGWRITIVVIDTDFDRVSAAREDHIAAIQGDISNPREISKLNIRDAAGIVLAINDPNVTLFAGQAVKVANPNIWVISEKNIHISESMYRSVNISKAVDRFSASKSKIRGIIWGLEVESFDFSMGDGISFFQIPMIPGFDVSYFEKADFNVLGLIRNNEFTKIDKNKDLLGADFLLVGGPSSKTKDLIAELKSHLPPDDDGVVRVMVIGFGEYAETILPSILSNSDEVIVVDIDDEKRKLAKSIGGTKVESRNRASKEQMKLSDIVLLTSKAAGHMLALAIEIKNINPNAKLYARASISEHTTIFEAAGADYVFSPEVDCAVQLSSTVIYNLFQTQSIPFANGQLLFHAGNINVKNVDTRDVLAVYNAKKGKTEFFGKRSKKPDDYVLEFIQFKENEFLNLEKIIYGNLD